MFVNRVERDVDPKSPPFRLENVVDKPLTSLEGGDGVVKGAEDWAVVLDDVDGIRSPGLPGVAAKLVKEAKERSAGMFVLVPERSGCVVSAADIYSRQRSARQRCFKLKFKMVVPRGVSNLKVS